MALNSLKVADLRARLSALGEDGAGVKKADLIRAIQRLETGTTNASPLADSAPAATANAPPVATAAAVPVDPSNLTVAELKNELAALGAPVSGNKVRAVSAGSPWAVREGMTDCCCLARAHTPRSRRRAHDSLRLRVVYTFEKVFHATRSRRRSRRWFNRVRGGNGLTPRSRSRTHDSLASG